MLSSNILFGGVHKMMPRSFKFGIYLFNEPSRFNVVHLSAKSRDNFFKAKQRMSDLNVILLKNAIMISLQNIRKLT